MRLDRFITLCFTAAEPECLISILSDKQIEMVNVDWIDLLTVKVSIKYSQLAQTRGILSQMGARYHIVSREGLLWYIFSMCKRPVLLIGMICFAFLALYLPGRILQINICGNERITNNQMLQVLEDAGICIGAKTSEIRSEDIKNALQRKLPELQWVGVTTSGCIATVNVKERSIAVDEYKDSNTVSSIVAIYDGIISEMTVYCGNPLYRVGEAVKAGDTIISGYADYGIKTVAQRANGEVFAYTHRNLHMITPINQVYRENEIRECICYRLQIGKKVINLCNHSGISDSSCVKMYTEYYWHLPGDYQLPVSVHKVICRYYEMTDIPQTDEDIQWIPQYARQYLLSKMVSGNILSESFAWNTNSDIGEYVATYACHEMIGKEKREEIVK